MCRQEDGYSFMPGDIPHMHLVSSVYSYGEKKETAPQNQFCYFNKGCLCTEFHAIAAFVVLKYY